MIDLEAKKAACAQIIEGRVVDDQVRVAVCIKGSVLGFPATLEAVQPKWPFGVTYYLETKVIDDPQNQARSEGNTVSVLPRHGKGLMAIVSRILLFESHGLPIGDKKMESAFIFSYTDRAVAERFLKYPGVWETLCKLEQYCKFSELTIRVDAGLALSQSRSFVNLDLDVYRETFKLVGELGQILFEAF
jgi:hypothetical protein